MRLFGTSKRQRKPRYTKLVTVRKAERELGPPVFMLEADSGYVSSAGKFTNVTDNAALFRTLTQAERYAISLGLSLERG